MEALAAAVEASALGEAARGVWWLYPLANVAHVLGVALLVGGIAVYDLLLLRRRADRSAAAALAVVARTALPLALAGAALALASGGVLFAADAVALSGNPLFWTKLGLAAAGAANAALFHWRPAGTGRGHAALSLLLWTAALSAGRLIAYA